MKLTYAAALLALMLVWAAPVLGADAATKSSQGSEAPAAKSGSTTGGLKVDLSNAKMNTRTAPPIDELQKFKRSGPKVKASDLGAIVVKRGGKVSSEPAAPDVEALLQESRV
ncbi:MAG: hypothetical protein AAF405_06170, partial [Pseudomonadota bacterium]